MRWTICAFLVLPLLAARSSAAEDTTHVRSLDEGINQFIARGIAQSPTFRDLVAAIDASDSYVYVQTGDCKGGVRSCFVGLTAVRSARFLRVKVNSRNSDVGVVSSIGHELRHALEVIEDPAVRTNKDFYFFYARIGTRSLAGTFETSAAVGAGSKIRDEVLAYERRHTP